MGAILAAIDIHRPQILHQILQRGHRLAIGEITGDGGYLISGAGLERFGDGIERFGPICLCQLAVLAYIAAVQPALLEAVTGEAGFIGYPLFVHVLVEARDDAHDFAATSINADI